MTRPRILYLSHSLIPSRQANGLQVMKMCEAFSEAGADVVLYCRRSRAPLEELHAYYDVRHPFPVRGLRLPRVPLLTRTAYSALTFARLLAEPRPDLIYGRDAYLLALIAMQPLLRCPLVFEAHLPPSTPLERFLQRRIFASRRFRRLVVISEALGKAYEELFGELVEGKVVVARDGADPGEAPAPDSAERPEAAGGMQLGYVGSLSPGKGMEVIAQLAPLLPECTFHVVGGSAREVDHWRGRSPRENVVFHGYQRPEDVRERLERFDVVLAPYQARVPVGHKAVDASAWMSPLKIFEYMAAEKAIVASDLPVLGEFLRDGENALLVPPDDPRAWARSIARLRDDASYRRGLGRRAGVELRRSYTWEQRARRLLEAAEVG